MFWLGVIACIVMLIVFFGVTVAGGMAHDRQNLENSMKTARSDPFQFRLRQRVKFVSD